MEDEEIARSTSHMDICVSEDDTWKTRPELVCALLWALDSVLSFGKFIQKHRGEAKQLWMLQFVN